MEETTKISSNSKEYEKECSALTKNYGGEDLLDEGSGYQKLDHEVEAVSLCSLPGPCHLRASKCYGMGKKG